MGVVSLLSYGSQGIRYGSSHLYLMSHLVNPVLISSEPAIFELYNVDGFVKNAVPLYDFRTGTWASGPQHGTLTSLPSEWACHLRDITRKPRVDVDGLPLALLLLSLLQDLDQSL